MAHGTGGLSPRSKGTAGKIFQADKIRCAYDKFQLPSRFFLLTTDVSSSPFEKTLSPKAHFTYPEYRISCGSVPEGAPSTLERSVIMDPATAIGLVSGILSFVGAVDKILKLTWTLYNSVEGSSEETETRSKVDESMNEIGRLIIADNQPASAEENRALVALAQECSELTQDIRKVLHGLKPKRRKSKTQSGLVALKMLMVEPKIKDLERRLQHCRGQLHLHIDTLTR